MSDVKMLSFNHILLMSQWILVNLGAIFSNYPPSGFSVSVYFDLLLLLKNILLVNLLRACSFLCFNVTFVLEIVPWGIILIRGSISEWAQRSWQKRYNLESHLQLCNRCWTNNFLLLCITFAAHGLLSTCFGAVSSEIGKTIRVTAIIVYWQL